MTSITKPPVRPKLSHKDEQCHRLVRLLMRAYYEKEHVAIVDCLLDMQVKQANKVTEADLAAELHLSPKLIREILHRLRQDQLVRGIQKAEAAPKVEELTSRGRRKNYVRAPTVTFTWHVDFEQVVNVVKFRHWDIFEKLNKKVDRADVFYICPTRDCENHAASRKRSVMDLLLDQRGGGAGDGIFRCELCFTINTVDNTKHATPLVLLTHQETGGGSGAPASSSAAGAAGDGAAAAAASSSASSSIGVDHNQNLKNKFNKQLGVILEQLMRVDRLLQEDLLARKEQIAAGVLPPGMAGATATGGAEQKASLIDFSHPAAAAAAAAAGSAAGASSAAAAAAASGQSLEDMISVNLSGSGGGDGPMHSVAEPAAKKVKMEHVIGQLSRDALPWDKHAPPLSLAKVEEEKRAQEAAKSAAAAAEAARLAEAERVRFQKEYEEQLAKQQQAAAEAASAAAAAAEAAAAAASSSLPHDAHDLSLGGDLMHMDEQSMSVGGRVLPLSAITQDDIDQMTTEEFDLYSQLAGGHEEF